MFAAVSLKVIYVLLVLSCSVLYVLYGSDHCGSCVHGTEAEIPGLGRSLLHDVTLNAGVVFVASTGCSLLEDWISS